MPAGEKIEELPSRSSLRLARVGSFHVGGRSIRIIGQASRDVSFTASASMRHDPNGHFHIEQAYVQFFIPESVTFSLPLVMLHGGGFSGSMWERTPDGRDGWLQAFLRRGFAVNVVDNVERGRAGWTPFPSEWPERPIMRSAEEAWSLFRLGHTDWGPGLDCDRADATLCKPFPGQRFPVAHMTELLKMSVPRWIGNNDLAVACLRNVLHRTGPCVLLAHSQGAEIALRAACAEPALVRSIVAIEPSGFATDLTRESIAGRQHLFVYGDYINLSPLWVDLVKHGEAFGRDVVAKGGSMTWWSLPAHGIHGNSHMIMMDENSDQIAGAIADWLLTLSIT